MTTWLFLLAAAGSYAGAEKCATCHGEIYRTQSRSHHASALRPILASGLPEKLQQRPVAERGGASFEYLRAANGLRVTARREGEEAAGVLEWAFGSGAQGSTPVGRVGGRYFEHRVSWYERPQRPGVTFGHPAAPPATALAALGEIQSAGNIERCFGCHATGSKVGPDLSTMTPGVTCERCHGAAAAHAARPSKNNVTNPGRMDASAQVRFCGGCHRLPARSAAAPEAEDPLSVRYAPVGLMASRCYQRSGRLTCLTCHDPHANADPAPPHYEAKCAGCHAAPAAGSCPRGPGCLGCHMKKERPVPDLEFTDHRIRIPDKAGASGQASPDWIALEAAISAGNWQRARALLDQAGTRNARWHILASKVEDGLNDPARAVAEAEAALALEPRNEGAHLQLGQIFLARHTPDAAVDIFTDALALFPDSLMLRLGRGLAYKDLGRLGEAEQDLRACLRKSPELALAFDGLATLLIQGRRFPEARELAVEFRRRNPRDYRGPYFLAAALQGEKETGQDIEALLEEALRANPGFAAAWSLLGKVLVRGGRVEEAVGPLERAVALRPDLAAARLQLAAVYRTLGREADAEREFRAVRERKEKEQPPPRLVYRRGR